MEYALSRALSVCVCCGALAVPRADKPGMSVPMCASCAKRASERLGHEYDYGELGGQG